MIANSSVQEHKKTRIAELDVLRGVAAFAVVIFHYSGHCTRYLEAFPFNFTIGHYGVELFFVISGFVILMTLERCKTVTDFAISRFSRLYPAYWATLALLIALDLLKGSPVWITGYAVNSTMMQRFVGIGNIDDVFWTLGVELAFYLLIATFFAIAGTRNIFIAIAIWLATINLLLHCGAMGDTQLLRTATLILIPDYAPYFAAGAAFYQMRDAQRLPPLRLHIIVGICWVSIAMNKGTADSIAAAILFSIFYLLQLTDIKSIANPITIWLGTISYSLYLTHRNFGYTVLFALDRAGVPSLVAFSVAIAAALALASALTYCVEQPAMRKLRSLLSHRRTERR